MMRKPDLIFLSLTEAAKQLFGYEQVAKRIANIRLNKVRQAEENSICEKSMLTQEVLR